MGVLIFPSLEDLVFLVVREVPTRNLHMIDIEDLMTADNQTLPRFSSQNSNFDFLIVRR